MFLTASLSMALLILRAALGLFMLIWAIEKFVRPESYAQIYQYFYGLPLGGTVVTLLGVLQVAIVIAFLAGYRKTLSYAAVALMNAASLVVSLPLILAPYQGETNHLFVASIPIVAASAVLFLLRDHDTALTVS